MRRLLLLLPACLAFAALPGCGNKGPLYYPPAAPKPAAAKPAPAPAHAAPTVAPASSSSAPAAASSSPASASSVATKPLNGG